MTEFHKFDDDAINKTIQSARAFHAEQAAPALESLDSSSALADSGELSILAQCISLKVANHKVCLDLPLGIGKVCLPIPFNIPDGEAAKACLKICTTWGIPHGVRVTISVAGVEVVSKTFGKC
ncbi:hypothetical protein HKCCE2091_09470 [Rhodobacterales bacterium HKCCE2091]|nr:hypothetical protein [Rhodobacterales bacterium HKCCE2091]